jgi:hypothetical protein
MRDHLRGEQERKAAMAAGLVPPRPYQGGPSIVDRMASAMKGGIGPGSRAGGGVAYRRGGVSLAQASAMNAQRARQQRASAEANAAFDKSNKK